MIARLDHEIDLHQSTLEGAAHRFEHRQAASRAVISHGLEQQWHAANLAQRLDAERIFSTACRLPPRCATLPLNEHNSKDSHQHPSSRQTRARRVSRCKSTRQPSRF
jgi:hypothetical protein